MLTETRTSAARAVDLQKVYGAGDAAVEALRGISVVFAPGEFAAIMGPSGSGKSTLLHCMAGLDTPTSGEVFIGDIELTSLSERQLTRLRRDRVGFVFQAYNLVPTLTAAENITLPLDIAGRDIDGPWFDRVVDAVGLRDRLGHLPSELSGGQQQRVAGARALVSRPDVVFADEPTGNLDSRASAELLTFLRSAVDDHGQTIVMVTHDAMAAGRSDRTVFLADGRVVDEMSASLLGQGPRPPEVAGGLSRVARDREEPLGSQAPAAAHRALDRPRDRVRGRDVRPHRHDGSSVRGALRNDDGGHRCGGARHVGVRAGSRQPGRQRKRLAEPDPRRSAVGGAGGARSRQRRTEASCGYAQMVDPETEEAIGGFGPPTIGVNWQDGSSVLVLRSGEPPTAPDEVVIDAATARTHDLSIDERLQILFEGPPGDFTITGIAGFGEADNLAGATLAAFETETAQQVLGREGVFDEISVVAEEGEAPTQLRARIEAVLPDRVEAVTATTVADEQAEALQEGLGFFRIALLVFAFIALFVGSFIIFNTFSIIVAQRTRELALLRALGASRRQVMTSVIAEAFLTGLDRIDRGDRRGDRDRPGDPGAPQRVRDRSPQHHDATAAANDRRLARGRYGGHGCRRGAPGAPGVQGCAGRGTARRTATGGGAGTRTAGCARHRGARPRDRRAPVRAVRDAVERRHAGGSRSGCDVHRRRDALAASRPATGGLDRRPAPVPGRAGEART